MSFFKAAAVDIDEKPLYDRLRQLFYVHNDVIRARRLPVKDHVIHTIRNKRTKNVAVVKDFRNLGRGVQLCIYEHRAHNAQNIGKEQDLVIDKMYHDIDDPEMIDHIFTYLSKESDYSRTPFVKIKATKKDIDDLADDEVFAGRIVKITMLNTRDGEAYDMQYENNSGTYIKLVEEVHKTTNNPLGQYVVINNRRKDAIIRPNTFLDGYEIVESELQVSRPADLIP